MADGPVMFGPTRGFTGMADSMEPCKIWARRRDPDAYRLVCIIFIKLKLYGKHKPTMSLFNKTYQTFHTENSLPYYYKT